MLIIHWHAYGRYRVLCILRRHNVYDTLELPEKSVRIP